MQYLAAQRRSGVTRVRKLAAIRKFFTFLEENKIPSANPANAVKGARREEKEPNILYKSSTKRFSMRPPTISATTRSSRPSCKPASA